MFIRCFKATHSKEYKYIIHKQWRSQFDWHFYSRTSCIQLMIKESTHLPVLIKSQHIMLKLYLPYSTQGCSLMHQSHLNCHIVKAEITICAIRLCDFDREWSWSKKKCLISRRWYICNLACYSDVYLFTLFLYFLILPNHHATVEILVRQKERENA